MHNTGFFISLFFVSIRHGSYGLFAMLLFVYKRLLQLFGKTGFLAFAFWFVWIVPDFMVLHILLVVAQSSWE